jgi:hypothetical protein
MAVAYSTALRNARLDAITTAVGASGKLRIYDGTRPSSGGTATNLLAELTFVMDGDAGASGSGKELILDSTSIVETGEVDVTSFVITAGNA